MAEVGAQGFVAILALFSLAAVMATVCLAFRQPLILAYILTGVVIGPAGLGLLTEPASVGQIGHTGIIFLLFLVGMELSPKRLFETLTTVAGATVLTSIIFALVGFSLGIWVLGLDALPAIILGMCAAFSSTIIGIKLLPTTVLHHKAMGRWVVSTLLVQDVLAVVALGSMQERESLSLAFDRLLAIPGLAVVCYGCVRFGLVKLFSTFDRYQEYMFLLTLGWCLGVAWLAHWIGLSHEIGAFIAGVGLATHPVSQYIAAQLRPLRDFFLIVFFVSVGASVTLEVLWSSWWQVLLVGLVFTIGKGGLFYWVFQRLKLEDLSKEAASRLSQMSEFSLLIAAVALEKHLIGSDTAGLIVLATVLSMTLSTYWVVYHYPTPIAVSDRLRRD